MKRKLLLILVLSTLLLVACTSSEQKAYEEFLQQAKDKIESEEFAEAEVLLTEAISTGYEDNEEAQNLLKQLQQYLELENLLSEGKFEEIYERIASMSKIKMGSAFISEKVKEFQAMAKKQEEQFNKLQASVNKTLKLVEDMKYYEANKQLKALDLSDYPNYYKPIIKKVTDTIDSNDKKITAIEEQKEKEATPKDETEKKEEAGQKDETEKKEEKEAGQKSNMLNWTDGEIHDYIANHLGMPPNHLIFMISDHTDSGYTIEVREDHAAMGEGDPMTAPALGFFEVQADGKLYEMDSISGEYFLVN